MAKNNTTNNNAGDEKKEIIDFVAQIGRNLNPKNAADIFGGKAHGYRAMHAVAEAGGYGVFKDEDFDNKLFGGFAIPQGDDHSETRTRINEALNNLQ